MGLLTQAVLEGRMNREAKELPNAEPKIRALECNVTEHNEIEGFGVFAGKYNPLQIILVGQHSNRNMRKIRMISSFLTEISHRVK
jgi:hypothetical protein